MLLEVKDLDVRYGRVEAVKALNLEVGEREIVTVVGANGAGKSSLLKAILGVEKAESGQIHFDGEDITRQSTSHRIKNHLVLVPEGRRILISMTIHENLLLGAHARKERDVVEREIQAIYKRFPNLAERRDMQASCLSGGEQQMLAIGRALLAKPKLLMLDEPSLGLSPLFVNNLFDLIKELNHDGLSILLVEQNTGMALKVADRGYVMDLGRVTLSGIAADLATNPKLQEAYLGA